MWIIEPIIIIDLSVLQSALNYYYFNQISENIHPVCSTRKTRQGNLWNFVWKVDESNFISDVYIKIRQIFYWIDNHITIGHFRFSFSSFTNSKKKQWQVKFSLFQKDSSADSKQSSALKCMYRAHLFIVMELDDLLWKKRHPHYWTIFFQKVLFVPRSLFDIVQCTIQSANWEWILSIVLYNTKCVFFISILSSSSKQFCWHTYSISTWSLFYVINWWIKKNLTNWNGICVSIKMTKFSFITIQFNLSQHISSY